MDLRTAICAISSVLCPQLAAGDLSSRPICCTAWEAIQRSKHQWSTHSPLARRPIPSAQATSPLLPPGPDSIPLRPPKSLVCARSCRAKKASSTARLGATSGTTVSRYRSSRKLTIRISSYCDPRRQLGKVHRRIRRWSISAAFPNSRMRGWRRTMRWRRAPDPPFFYSRDAATAKRTSSARLRTPSFSMMRVL